MSRVYGQAPEIEWQNTIGGSLDEILTSVSTTMDSGFILGGYSSSTNTGDKTEVGSGWEDYWVVKLNSIGGIEWQNTIGGNEIDRLFSINQTSDSGYILGGYSSSGLSGDKTEMAVGNDYWIIKIDADGNIIWQNTIGGSGDDLLSVVQQSPTGYLIGGYTTSGVSGDKTDGNFGNYDFWVLKLDISGNIVWQKTFGGDNEDRLYDIYQTFDGGSVICGSSLSGITGNKTEPNNGGKDYWVIKLDSIGNILWQNTIGGNFDDIPKSIQQTSDGEYIIGGTSSSDIFGDKTESSIGAFGSNDFWVLKLDISGNIVWQNTIGGSSSDNLLDIQEAFDSGFILAGGSLSDIGFDKSEINFGQTDYWIVKVDSDGNLVWDNTIGGTATDFLYAIDFAVDGGLIIGGYSHSEISWDKTEGNIGTGTAYADYWVIKLIPEDCITPFIFYGDIDNDGFGNISDTLSACIPPIGYVLNSADCNDSNYNIHPFAVEICNDLDDNCNFTIDEGLTMNTFYNDEDGDSFGDADLFINSCLELIAGYVFDSTDCDDLNILVNPSAMETCNSFDDNCNLTIDEDLTFITYYIDADGDNYGNADIDTVWCLPVTGYIIDSTDCDDSNALIYPDAPEILDGIDNNCNKLIDEGLTINETILNSIKIYPNPTVDILFVEYSGYDEVTFELINIGGQILWLDDIVTSFVEIDVSKFASGIYLLKIKTPDGDAMVKFVKD